MVLTSAKAIIKRPVTKYPTTVIIAIIAGGAGLLALSALCLGLGMALFGSRRHSKTKAAQIKAAISSTDVTSADIELSSSSIRQRNRTTTDETGEKTGQRCGATGKSMVAGDQMDGAYEKKRNRRDERSRSQDIQLPVLVRDLEQGVV